MKQEKSSAPKRTVLVVGAGASVAHALTLGVTKHLLPPLDKTFLQTAPSWSPVTAKMFRDRVQECLAEPDLANYRMEQVFSYAYLDAQYYELRTEKTQLSESALRAWAESARFLEVLINELRLALAMTTNPLACGSTDGALGPLLKRLLDECDGNLTVITFNQDLLLERALEALHQDSRHGTPYAFPKLYGIAFDKVESGSGNLHKLGTFAPCSAGHEGVLLKLHGSFNWFLSTQASSLIDQTPPLYSTLFHQGGKTLCLDSRELVMDGRVSIRPKHSGFDRWLPLVVPPVATKTTWLDSPLWPLWEQAERALASASRVVIWGYSLPETDRHALRVITTALAERQSDCSLTVIDPDKRVAARLQAHLGSRVTWHVDHAAYLAAGTAPAGAPSA